MIARVIAVDPGPTQSGFVVYDGARVLEHGIESTKGLAHTLQLLVQPQCPTDVVLEGIEGMGMIVGREVFETVFLSGRLFEAAATVYGGGHVHRLFRRDVKLHLCGSSRAKDPNIRTALLDRFGGEVLARGRKAAPGPLYGVRSHEWAALAVAVTWWDRAVLLSRSGAALLVSGDEADVRF